MFLDFDDTKRSVTLYSSPGVLGSTATPEGELLLGSKKNPRPYTEQENLDANARKATRTTIGEILKRIEDLEQAVWPVKPNPSVPTGIKTFEEWSGRVPNNALILEDGVVYRNVSKTVLTTRPRDFPPPISMWEHLWKPVLGTPPTPQPDPEVEVWDGNFKVYAMPKTVMFNEHKYSLRQNHTSQPTYTPEAVPALWSLIS